MRKEIWIIIFLFSALNIVFILLCVFNRKKGFDSAAEKTEYRIKIKEKQAEIDSLRAAGDTLRTRISKDSLIFQQRLDRINKQIHRLKDNVKKIDYKYYFVPQLDSVGERLYPSAAHR